MNREVRQPGPGNCPKGGMALEPEIPSLPTAAPAEYTCPMHPEIVRDAPGACPICGMALEPKLAASTDENPELVDMTRCFWTSVALALPVFLMAMGGDLWPAVAARIASPYSRQWVDFWLPPPHVLWRCLPLLVCC